jgi:hypothetical protein
MAVTEIMWVLIIDLSGDEPRVIREEKKLFFRLV